MARLTGAAMVATAKALQANALLHKRAVSFHRRQMHESMKQLAMLHDEARKLGFEIEIVPAKGGNHGRSTVRP